MTGACWCAEVTVPDEVRADLQTRYKQCLCRACLERAAASGRATFGESSARATPACTSMPHPR
jgi:hypothetical protein